MDSKTNLSSQPELSVIIPTLNEAENLLMLLSRLEKNLDALSYEVIIIDDHSTDKTLLTQEVLTRYFPLRFFTKKGEKGKGYSLVEGFQYARAPYIAYIDADLQYPPEAIPKMLEKLCKGSDIVIANRHNDSSSQSTEKWQRRVLGRQMHDLDVDIQSGLKLFRREVVERIELHPKAWRFDLEFLVNARNAGYRIAEVDIPFVPRQKGVTKNKKLRSSWELFTEALLLKFKDPDVVPFAKKEEEKKGKGFHYQGVEYISHTSLPHQRSAFVQFIFTQKFVLLTIFCLLLVGLALNWHTTIVALVAVLTLLYFADLLFNFFLIYRSFSKAPEVQVSNEEMKQNEIKEWPVYTIFCPLYKEVEVLPQFIKAMTLLDYPKEKLQVMLLLEEDDISTREKVASLSLPEQFEVITVPHSLPKTKPKALNYGLQYATGEYIVIYDAEDIPDPMQLKKAILAFSKVDKRIVCIQAKLNFYNPHQNVLTRVFTAEYSLWFDLVLTGLQSLHAPIPLGGTSNHFKKSVLQELKGWDSFNVTEDCDLGMRLVKHGYQTAVIDSITQEEANSDLRNWFNQRTRWIKGYIQSYFVHMRAPQDFISNWREPHVITFQLIVGGKILSMFINPFMWLITISYFAFRPFIGTFIESFYPAPVLYMGIFSLLIGNFLYMYYYMIGCYKRGEDSIIKYVFLVPFYWLAMSLAAWRALYQIATKPHYWPKTKHGYHLTKVEKADEEREEFSIPKISLFPEPRLAY